MPREEAIFEGPKPLLLGATEPDDLIILLCGPDRKTTQGERNLLPCLGRISGQPKPTNYRATQYQADRMGARPEFAVCHFMQFFSRDKIPSGKV